MGVSTRPSHKHRQASAVKRGLAVFLFWAFACPEMAVPSPTTEDAPRDTLTNSIAHDTSHEITQITVRPGEESIMLSARLTTMSSHIARDVQWSIEDSDGQKLLDATSSQLSSPMQPGDYRIEAKYGAVVVHEVVHIEEGTSVNVTLVLNAGALRVLPTLKGLPNHELAPVTRVYALHGLNQGQLVTQSALPGELIKLPVGLYRVESKLGDGNASAVTDVRVRPGKMSAVELALAAGVARLNFAGSRDTKVVWGVSTAEGEHLSSFEGASHLLALKPGTYLAEAKVGDKTLSAKFDIVAGEERAIILGN